jgi:tRNA/rRNA methyltransferase
LFVSNLLYFRSGCCCELTVVELRDRIRIILIEPAGARNVGAIARVMKNMGLSQLWLVQPECDWLSDEARHMAVHAGDLLTAAQVVQTLPEALAGCCVAGATIGRDTDRPILPPRSALQTLCETVAATELAGAVIFGREDHGLNNLQLDQAQLYIAIPTSPVYPSLNLAQAVGIVVYELQLLMQAGVAADRSAIAPVADLAQVEGYLQDLAALLLEVGYLQDHTCDSRMAKLRDLLKRSDPKATDVAMLRGMIRQIKWQINQGSPLPDR